jgi:hypothetical protein
MKKLLLTLALAVGAMNSGFAADLYVNNSGQSGTYTTIQAAINAASTGDNIYVSPLNSYQESLSITKSIRIASSVAGSRIIVTQDIKISPLANILVELIGVEGTNVILDTQTSTLGPNSRGKAIITDCSFGSINLSTDYLTLIVVKCTLSASLYGRHGKILGCVVAGSINFDDEPNVGIGDTILVKANKVSGEIKIESDDHSMVVENNVARRIRLGSTTYSTLLNYYITNNTINAVGDGTYTSTAWWALQSGLININTSAVNLSNIFILNNKGILQSPYIRTGSQDRTFYSMVGVSKTATTTGGQVTTAPNIHYNFWAAPFNNLNFLTNTGTTQSSSTSAQAYASFYSEIYFPNQTVGGTYGKAVFAPKEIGVYNSHWNFDNTANPVVSNPHDLNSFYYHLQDKGSPSPKFFDADLTRSDIGHLGGDNSWEMFHGTNSVTGAAYIIGLDLPSEIWPGQTVNLKAEAVHTN